MPSGGVTTSFTGWVAPASFGFASASRNCACLPSTFTWLIASRWKSIENRPRFWVAVAVIVDRVPAPNRLFAGL